MYIEFTLPSGAGGLAAGHARMLIDNEIREWSEQYGISYKTKTVKYTHRIILTTAEDYTMFGLTFSPKSKKFVGWLNSWRFVEPMNPPKTN